MSASKALSPSKSEIPLGACQQAEHAIRQALRAGDSAEAAAAVWRAYRGEVFGWLRAVHGPVDAADICGGIAVSIVRSIAGFRGQSTVRTWVYQVARNEARQFLRASRRQRGVLTPLENHPSAYNRAALSNSGRSGQLHLLRQHLSADDRSLLILRYDRGLSYEEIATILEAPQTVPDRMRVAVKLRQRLHALRTKLQKLHQVESGSAL